MGSFLQLKGLILVNGKEIEIHRLIDLKQDNHLHLALKIIKHLSFKQGFIYVYHLAK